MNRNEEQNARPGQRAGNRLQVIFETAEPGAGVPLDDLRLVLGHLSEAVRLLARDLRNDEGRGTGEGNRSDSATEDSCPLRVLRISGGSVVLDLAAAPTGDSGRRAIRAILGGSDTESGANPPTFPAPVADRLAAGAESRTAAVPSVRLHDPDSGRETAIRRTAPERAEPFDREAFLARPRKPFSFDDLPTIDDLTPEEAETFRRHLRAGRRS